MRSVLGKYWSSFLFASLFLWDLVFAIHWESREIFLPHDISQTFILPIDGRCFIFCFLLIDPSEDLRGVYKLEVIRSMQRKK